MRGSRMDKCCVLEEPIEREILTRCILRLQVVLPRDRSQHNPPVLLRGGSYLLFPLLIMTSMDPYSVQVF